MTPTHTTPARHITSRKPWPAAADGALTAARKLVARGCMVLPVPFRHKNPKGDALNLRLGGEKLTDAELKLHFSDEQPMNIGVIMGERSGGLVDVNINDTTARRLAPRALGFSTLTFGNGGHYIVYCHGVSTVEYKDPASGDLLVEVRADPKRGRKPAQTIFPPSTHEHTGEQISFDNAAEPHVISSGELTTAVARLAAVTLLSRHMHHVDDYALIGAFVRAGWDDVAISKLWALLSDTSPDARIDNARGRISRGEPIAGWPAVEDRMGRAATQHVVRWLGARPCAGNADFEGRAVAELLDDPPVPNLKMPAGYAVNATDTLALGQPDDDGSPGEPISIAHAPLLVTGKLRTLVGDHEHLHLSWRGYHGWRSVTMERREALDNTKLVDFANAGLPVASDNAREVARYLRHFEAANDAHLPTATITAQLGWQPDNVGFLLGLIRIASDGEHSADFYGQPPAAWPDNAVTFHGAGDGDKRLANAFRTAGNEDIWHNCVSEMITRYPAVAVAFYAALVPPLLDILRVPNFLIDLTCTTSHGKTTALRVAASTWGDPDERSSEGSLIHPWNNTRVATESICALYNGLPVFLDDSKTAKKESDVEQVIYDVCQGQTRGRGDPRGGRKEVHSFRTVMLSTGERPLTSFSQAGGTRARCLELTEPPFGLPTEETRLDVNRINRELTQHYGHGARAYMRTIMARRDDWPVWQAEYHARSDVWAQHIAPGAGARTADYLAAIETAAVIANAALCLPPAHTTALALLLDVAQRQSASAPPEVRGLDVAWQWAVAHQQEFYGRHRTTGGKDPEPIQPSSGWAGVWNEQDDWDVIYWIPEQLRRVLDNAEFDADAVLDGWSRRGWLEHDPGRNTKKLPLALTAMAGGARIRVVAMRRAAIPDASSSE